MVLTREERSKANWKGMLKWWGVPDSHGIHHPPSTNLSKEEEYWLRRSERFVDDPDPVERVYEICPYLRDSESDEDAKSSKADSRRASEGDSEESEDEEPRRNAHHLTTKEFEDVLDELKGYADSIDLTQELYLCNGLHDLLFNIMDRKHAGIRAKAAEVISAMVHNNPSNQELIMEFNGLQPLLDNLFFVHDVTSRTKALGAISSLIRNNQLGIAEFRLENGYVPLKDALSSESVMFQREALNLIQYLLHENSSDCDIVTELGLPHIMMDLTSGGDDAEVREASLRCLLVLARYEGGSSRQLLKNDDKLKQVLQERIQGFSAMAPKDLGAAREEKQLVDSLWNACYDEPPSLAEKGILLVLRDEDAPAPDVASKLFEPPPLPPPPPRACAAAEGSSVIEKGYNIVTELGGLPRIMMHLVSSEDAEVREAALRGLLVIARDEDGNSGQLLKNDDKLKQVLQKRIEDLGDVEEERQLVDSLWSACYNEQPPSLRKKRPLVFPGEDAPTSEPPDTSPSGRYPSWKRLCPDAP